MKLYFLRHGVAVDAEVWDGLDSQRPLTPDGIARMKRQAKAMQRLGIVPDSIVSSPLLRAKQTAEIVAQRFDLGGRLYEDARLGLDFSVDALRAVVEERAGSGAVMLVGHEPSMSETIVQIIGGGRIDLKKGGLAYVCVPKSASPRERWYG